MFEMPSKDGVGKNAKLGEKMHEIQQFTRNRKGESGITQPAFAKATASK